MIWLLYRWFLILVGAYFDRAASADADDARKVISKKNKAEIINNPCVKLFPSKNVIMFFPNVFQSALPDDTCFINKYQNIVSTIIWNVHKPTLFVSFNILHHHSKTLDYGIVYYDY